MEAHPLCAPAAAFKATLVLSGKTSFTGYPSPLPPVRDVKSDSPYTPQR